MSEPRRRFVLGAAIPLAALLAGGALIWSISRILLAADEEIAPVIGLLFALNILVAGALAASVPRKGTVLAVVVAVVIPVVAAGLVGFFVGERPIEALVEEGPVVEEPEGGEAAAPEEEPEEPEAAAEATLTIVALEIAFDTDAIELPAGEQVAIALDNQDAGVPHNVAIYTEEGGEAIFLGDIFPGVETRTYSFTAPDPGTYYFQCDVHPFMNGTVTVG